MTFEKFNQYGFVSLYLKNIIVVVHFIDLRQAVHFCSENSVLA